jgi:UDP-glucose 4-epimerase
MTLPARVGITGAAGFIGSNLAERLLAEGVEVVGVDDMSMGNLRNLAGMLEDPSFSLAEFDCRDSAKLGQAFAECDAIVHLAAMKIPRYGGALETLELNVDGSHAAFDVGMATGAHVVLASTSDVYGNAVPPFAEDDPIVLGPPTSRRWSYAASKYFDEHLALRLVEERGLWCTVLRFFNAYGPRNHPSWWGGPLSVFLEDLLDGRMMQLHGDGRQVRSFTYVSDTVDGIMRTLERPETSGEVINIGGDEPISIVKLAQQVQAAMGFAGPLRAREVPLDTIGGKYQDVRVRIPDTAKADRLLGFRATVDLEEGLRETVAWHRQLREEGVSLGGAVGVA